MTVRGCGWTGALQFEYTRHMADASNHATLQSAVLSSFCAILGGDQSQRRAAEEELQALEVAEGV